MSPKLSNCMLCYKLHGGGNKHDALQDVKHALAIFMMGTGC